MTLFKSDRRSDHSCAQQAPKYEQSSHTTSGALLTKGLSPHLKALNEE